MCVIEQEPQGGGGWNTETLFFPGREQGESEIGSRSRRSELSRPGLFHTQPPVLVSVMVPGFAHDPRSLTGRVRARSKGSKPVLPCLQHGCEGDYVARRVCVTMGTPKT